MSARNRTENKALSSDVENKAVTDDGVEDKSPATKPAPAAPAAAAVAAAVTTPAPEHPLVPVRLAHPIPAGRIGNPTEHPVGAVINVTRNVAALLTQQGVGVYA